MKTKVRHTPTPWKQIGPSGYTMKNRQIFFANHIGENSQQSNASFIVQAVNSHYELVETIKKTITNLEDFINPAGEFNWTEMAGRAMVRDLEKALSKAEWRELK